jgi:hypothetical protein
MHSPTRTDNYNTMVARTHTYFETREGRIVYEEEWGSITLNKVIA